MLGSVMEPDTINNYFQPSTLELSVLTLATRQTLGSCIDLIVIAQSIWCTLGHAQVNVWALID